MTLQDSESCTCIRANLNRLTSVSSGSLRNNFTESSRGHRLELGMMNLENIFEASIPTSLRVQRYIPAYITSLRQIRRPSTLVKSKCAHSPKNCGVKSIIQ